MKTLKLIAVAVTFALASAAQAGMNCKNDAGQAIRWEWGDPKPDLSDFEITQTIACYVNGHLYAVILPTIPGIPYVGGLPQGATGMLYRGDTARFLLENLPAAAGLPSTGADYRNREPN